MGQLLSIFIRDGDDCSCINPQNNQSLIINFVNAQPTEAEKEIYDEAEEFIKDSDKFIEQLKSFKGIFKLFFLLFSSLSFSLTLFSGRSRNQSGYVKAFTGNRTESLGRSRA